jgi:hypothetical protein
VTMTKRTRVLLLSGFLVVTVASVMAGRANERKLGTVYWSEASLHQVRNVGTTMSHTIRIELKY